MSDAAPRVRPGSERAPGTWAPLRNARFRRIGVAGAFSLSGYWMIEVACAWHMRLETGADPFRVSLVPAVMQLTVMAAVLPAGVISDLVDRRRLVLASHLWLAAAIAVLCALLLADLLTPAVLLAFLPLMSVSQAVRMPVIGSMVADAVRRDEIGAAVALNSLGQNGSRILGPAVAGALIMIGGPVAALAVAALTIAAAGLVLSTAVTPTARRTEALTAGRFVAELAAARDFVRRSAWKRNLIVRLVALFLCTSAVPVLLPVAFGSGAEYGNMLAVYGAGAVAGLLVMGRPLSGPAIERRSVIAQAVHACALVVVGLASSTWLAGIALLVCGAGWLVASNSIMTAAQLQLPAETRGRGLAVVYAAGMAGIAAGGTIWGAVARHAGIGIGFIAAAATSVALLLLLRRRHIFHANAPAMSD